MYILILILALNSFRIVESYGMSNIGPKCGPNSSGYNAFKYFGTYICDKRSYFKRIVLKTHGYSNITCNNVNAVYDSTNNNDIIGIDQFNTTVHLKSVSQYVARQNMRGVESYTTFLWLSGQPCDGGLIYAKADLYPYRGSCDPEVGVIESRTRNGLFTINGINRCESTCYGEVFASYCPGKTGS